MKTSMREEVIPLLQAQFLPEYYLKCSYLVCGITESALATRLATFEEQLPLGFHWHIFQLAVYTFTTLGMG